MCFLLLLFCLLLLLLLLNNKGCGPTPAHSKQYTECALDAHTNSFEGKEHMVVVVGVVATRMRIHSTRPHSSSRRTNSLSLFGVVDKKLKQRGYK